MNNIKRIFDESADVGQFAKGYFSYLSGLLDGLNTAAIAAVTQEIEEAHNRNNAVYIVGNGGSAATASHMANDIAMDVLKKSGIEHLILKNGLPIMDDVKGILI